MSTQLSRLLRPRHLAVVGGGAWCEAVIDQCQRFGFAGSIWPVHPNKSEFGGLVAFASVDRLPEAPDATFIGVNRFLSCEISAQLDSLNAGGAVCFASGFDETADVQAKGLQQTLLDKAGSLAVLGPNCYGLINAFDQFALWPDQHGCVPVDSGVAILTQSSNIAINLSMQQRGLPVGYLLTTGNQAQQDFASIGKTVLDDERVTALGLHIEGFGDIAAFESLMAKAHKLGKPVVALKVGKSVLAQKATQSHTASLAGTTAGSQALLDRLGVYHAGNLVEFIDQLKIVHLHGHGMGGRLASLSCSGGEASLIADAVEVVNASMGTGSTDGGLSFPPLNDKTKTRLTEQLGTIPALANPLDYHTDIWRNYDALKNVFSAMSGPQIDLTVLILDFPRGDRCSLSDWDIAVDAVLDSAAETLRPYALVASLPENLPESVCQQMMQKGVLSFHGIDEAVHAIASVAGMSGMEMPEPVLQGEAAGNDTTLTEAQAKAWLQQAMISVPQNASVSNEAGLLSAAKGLNYPLVLKGEGFAHKSESGAVQLNISDEHALRAAFTGMQCSGYLLEEQIIGIVAELLVGVTHDTAHGYLLTLGAGGVQTELAKDTQSLLIPATEEAVEKALSKLRIAPILNGYRGASGINWPLLIETVMNIQQFVISNVGKLSEFEINPLICTADQVIAADALIIGDINLKEDP
ncbi:MAG: acetate--CoA ligase family protein [Granulosicoccaceae bacterium]